jgi:type 1 glutamine amidotransferase
MKSNLRLTLPIALLGLAAASFLATGQDAATPAVKPLKALLVIGGCCHDYAKQKDILKAGLEERANLTVDICYSDNKTTKATFTCYDQENWAQGYDVIIHDECSADISDPAIIKRILDAHRNGTPGVNLHCAMHSYRSGDFRKPVPAGADNAAWFEYIGLQSNSHGKQAPIAVTYTADPSLAGLQNWTTINEELYNNVQIFPGTVTLAKGKQENEETVVVWAHEYGDKKTKVFSTTLGHNNETVADANYLDLVTRGLLWSTGHLTADGKPAPGYAPAKAVVK